MLMIIRAVAPESPPGVIECGFGRSSREPGGRHARVANMLMYKPQVAVCLHGVKLLFLTYQL
jgi:hypothetical protein